MPTTFFHSTTIDSIFSLQQALLSKQLLFEVWKSECKLIDLECEIFLEMLKLFDLICELSGSDRQVCFFSNFILVQQEKTNF